MTKYINRIVYYSKIHFPCTECDFDNFNWGRKEIHRNRKDSLMLLFEQELGISVQKKEKKKKQ